MAEGPPAATVSRDVSLCPTWKQRPHSAYYSRWSAIALSRVVSFAGPLLTESTRSNCKFSKSSKSKSSSRLANAANQFKKLLLVPVQKQIGSTLIRVDSVYLFNRFLRKPFLESTRRKCESI
ncbi:hypothetical protein PIB30_057454 [Stylosanthes scabra]|uniref:Uncharacterized protein n=1 Tax=Stylosanthes scabra TaxID=79078 RepID=A0ABU6XHN7_9FABA|nr:hypothetical protein [Stylosanthes scabra]